MKKVGKNIFRALLLPILGLSLVCCEKGNDAEDRADRLFSPPLFIAKPDLNEVKLSWIPIRNATYLLQISRDDLIFETDLQTFELSGVDRLEIDNLRTNTLYSARIKAVSKDPEIMDSRFNQITFRTDKEDIFITPQQADITHSSVLLSWTPLPDLTEIRIRTTDFDETYTLTPEEITAGQKLVEDLEPDKTYRFDLYSDDHLRDTISVKTSPEPDPQP